MVITLLKTTDPVFSAYISETFFKLIETIKACRKLGVVEFCK